MRFQQQQFSAPFLKLSLCALLTGLIGCGGSGGSDSPPPTAISSAESSAASSAGGNWELVWSDEFDGGSIDPTKWEHEQNCWGGGNNEQQCYTNRPENSFVADGVLNIVALKEEFTGSASPDGAGSTTKTLPYTSARLRTKNLQEWTFGRFEIRAKLPSGQGTWPAVWMLPTDSPYGTWAAGGEIDIMEAVNLKTVTDGGEPEARVHGTLHYGRRSPENVNSGTSYTLPNNANPADDFHVYALEWEEGEIRWYVDGVHYATQRDTGWYSQYLQDGVLVDAPVGAPFDRESAFHMLLNLAVGGSWAANENNKGIDDSVFPQTMQVDYVRVYECSASPESGKGCATLGDSATLVPGNNRPPLGDIELPGPPLFEIYYDELATGLTLGSYTTAAGQVSISEGDEVGRGKVLTMQKTGTTGNLFINVAGNPADLRNWSAESELIFDVRVNSKVAGAELKVKIDSGWPSVSDAVVAVGEVGEWKEFRIGLSDLVDNGNSVEAGRASLASVVNLVVLEPTDTMSITVDNIRIAGSANNTDQFAPLPLFNIFDDALAAGLTADRFSPGNISWQALDEVNRGKVFNVVKTATEGNVFLVLSGAPIDLSHWSANGELVFDFKVNSKADGASLLVKMDSGWPNVSDVSVPLPASNGVWTEYRIAVSDLIDNGNSISCCPGIARLSEITNIFVVEPSGAMDVSFDNIRLEIPAD